MEKNYPIDFIVSWVDGSDPEWIKSFNTYYLDTSTILDTSFVRYRDYDLLRYWFRGVEKFAPWVNKIHFVTCGQKPDWMNLECSKLHWVKHSDYIPAKYLPVFNSHPIELYMHKIPGLAEHFVYFNDDFYLTGICDKNFFFKQGVPRDCAILNALSATEMSFIIFNNLYLINKIFTRNDVIKSHLKKWINPLYGSFLLRTFCLLPWKFFTGFYDPHFACAYRKSVLEECWHQFPDELEATMNSRFRSQTDLNHWLFRYWQICTGNFIPQNPNRGKKYFNISDDIEEICKAIKNKNIKEIVLNDNSVSDFELRIKKIKQAFNIILPEKSSFEV